MRKTIPARLGALAGTAVLALALAACGSGGGSGGGDATGATGSGGTGGDKGFDANGAGGRPPGVSGKVAAVSGRTAQVQDQTSQTAVTWTASTTFTEEVSTTAAAVKVGSCVIASPAPSTSASGGATDDSTVAAASVRIVSSDGDCTKRPAVVEGGPRTFSGPSGGPSDRPSDRPSGRPSGFPSGRQVSFGAVGKVTALAAHGFTVEAVRPSGSGASPTTRTVSVTTGADTTYTTTRKATAAAVKVGRCLSAQGSTDSIGRVTATRVQLTAPVDGQCGLRILRGGPGAGGTTSGNA